MMLRRFFPILLFAFPLFAQYTESIEVRVTNVDVVVTDRNGKPVTGLGPEDFVVLEDGKPQTITNHYEVGEAATAATTTATGEDVHESLEPEAPAPIRKRHFLFFIDNYSLTFERNGVMKSLRGFLDRNLQAGDDVMVVMWDRNLSVVQPFTSDKAAIDAALAKVQKVGPHGAMLESEKKRAVDLAWETYLASLSLSQSTSHSFGNGASAANQSPTPPPDPASALSLALAYSEEARALQRQLFDAMHAMLTSMGSLEGRKVFVFAGAYMPDVPGLEIFERFSAKANGSNSAAFITTDTTSSKLPSHREEIAKISRHANAEGVTMYTIFAEDPVEVRDDPQKYREYNNSAGPFAALADLTGGTMLTKTANYDAIFETVARDASSYYSLGYRSNDNKPGQHAIVVKTKDPSYTVRSRKSYVVKSADERFGDRVAANVVQPEQASEIEVKVAVGETKKRARGEFLVPIDVTIPTSAVTLLQDGDTTMAGGFTVYIAAGTMRGGMSAVSKREQAIRVPKTGVAQLTAKPLVFHTEVLLGRGESIVSIGVVDRISNSAGYARVVVKT